MDTFSSGRKKKKVVLKLKSQLISDTLSNEQIITRPAFQARGSDSTPSGPSPKWKLTYFKMSVFPVNSGRHFKETLDTMHYHMNKKLTTSACKVVRDTNSNRPNVCFSPLLSTPRI